MLILAIDPGTYKSGWVLYEWFEHQGQFGGSILQHGTESNADMLPLIRTAGAIDVMAVEMIGHYGLGMAVGREVFETCVWIGRFWQAFSEKSHGAPVRFILRKQIALLLCGTVRAKDPNIRQALLDGFGPKGTKKAPGKTYGLNEHTFPALAAAVACTAGEGTDNGFARKENS